MLSKIRNPVVMCIVTALTLIGCASKPADPQEALKDNMQVMREAVTKVVKDVERQNNLLALTQSLEKTLSEYNRAYTDFAIEFGELNRNYDTPREKLEDLITAFRQTRKSAMKDVEKLHFEMVAQTSEDEWKKIVKKELEAIKSVRQLPEDQLRGKS